MGGFSPGVPTAHWNFEAIKTKFEDPETSRLSFLKLTYTVQLISELKQNDSLDQYPTFSNAELAAKAHATLENYESNLKIVRMFAREYGFKTYFFWQPVLAYGNKPLVPFEEKLKEA